MFLSLNIFIIRLGAPQPNYTYRSPEQIAAWIKAIGRDNLIAVQNINLLTRADMLQILPSDKWAGSAGHGRELCQIKTAFEVLGFLHLRKVFQAYIELGLKLWRVKRSDVVVVEVHEDGKETARGCE